MLEEGTVNRTADVLAEAIEDVGGTLDVAATGASLRVRAEDLPLALEILADVVRRPAFPAEALPWARRRIAAEIQGDRDDPAFRADLLFRHLVYGDHPYARDSRGHDPRSQAGCHSTIVQKLLTAATLRPRTMPDAHVAVGDFPEAAAAPEAWSQPTSSRGSRRAWLPQSWPSNT